MGVLDFFVSVFFYLCRRFIVCFGFFGSFLFIRFGEEGCEARKDLTGFFCLGGFWFCYLFGI